MNPPTKPDAMLNTASTGINVSNASILGNTMKLHELTPIISSASICSVTRIVPISEAMLDPTLPARIKHKIDDENSRRSTSRVASPTV